MRDLFYLASSPSVTPVRELVVLGDGTDRRFPFHERIEIGRYREGTTLRPGTLLIADPTVSTHHCVVSQAENGTCTVRDQSRNGTWVDGRRLIPGAETELHAGQELRLGEGYRFLLAERDGPAPAPAPSGTGGTVAAPTTCEVTTLVGDIGGYTRLVQTHPAREVQEAVCGVFARLERRVADLGGTVKEFQGDAIFAFWEPGEEDHAVAGCRAALDLDLLARELGRDAESWPIRGFPLRMEWALATGSVVMHSFGGERRSGLALVGEPVVLAYRLEKLAGEDTGFILASEATRTRAAAAFSFHEVGWRHLPGFEEPHRVFALLGERTSEDTP